MHGCFSYEAVYAAERFNFQQRTYYAAYLIANLFEQLSALYFPVR